MSDEPTTPDLVELTREAIDAVNREDGTIARFANYSDIDEARATAERLAHEWG
jgi:hypothetical protein